MTNQYLGDLIPHLERKLGVPQGFFESLDRDDETDWAFVIKLHALVEAAISHLLTESLNRPELHDIFSRLDMSNKSTGKAAFVEALGLMGKDERRFINSLSELRNTLVHDVRNVGFDLSEYVAGMNQKDQDAFLKKFNLLSTEVTDDVRNLFRFDPRQALWYAGMAFLGFVYLNMKPNELH